MTRGTAEGTRAPVPYETPSWAVGWCYLLEAEAMGWEKFGYSTQPSRREREFTLLPFVVEKTHEFPVGSRGVETRLHHFFEPRKVRGEWFSLGAEGIALVKSIREARSTLNLPEAFKAPRYVAPWAPAIKPTRWEVAASGFAFRLQALRTAHGLTHEQLAALCGLPPYHLRTLERAEAPFLSWLEVVALAKAFRVPTDEFRDDAPATDV